MQKLDEFLAGYNFNYKNLLHEFQQFRWDESYVDGYNNGFQSFISKSNYNKFCRDKKFVNLALHHLMDENHCEIKLRQLHKILRNSCEHTAQSENLAKYRFELESRLAGEIDHLFENSNGDNYNQYWSTLYHTTDINIREKAWRALHTRKDDLLKLYLKSIPARNLAAQEAGFSSYYHLQVQEAGFQEDELSTFFDKVLVELQPYYKVSVDHVSKKQKSEYPITSNTDKLPIHLFNNPNGAHWGQYFETPTTLSENLKSNGPNYLLKKVINFWMDFGFSFVGNGLLTNSLFYVNDSPMPQPQSSWHMDLDKDIRVVLNLSPNIYNYGTIFHELGHAAYYYQASQKSTPNLLRGAPSRYINEGVAELFRMMAFHPKFIANQGYISKPDKTEISQWATWELMEFGLPFLFYSAGTIANFEKIAYTSESLDVNSTQEIFRQLVLQYQQVEIPQSTEQIIAPFINQHLSVRPCTYHNYALATLVKYQLHDYIASDILKEDSLECDWSESKDAAAFLKEFMRQGDTMSPDDLLEKYTGQPISSEALRRRCERLISTTKFSKI